MAYVTCDVSISVDGYSSRPDQTREHPFGAGVDLHEWMFDTPEENADEVAAILGAGAYIMGRNMFGADRGEWDRDWQGWWGPEPPYHAPVFVLAHRPREPVELRGTTFHFVTDGVAAALARAEAVAGDRHVSIAGGASTVNQFLRAELLDELRLHVVPQVLGTGDSLFAGLPHLRLEQVSARQASLVTHLTYRVPRDR
jgi:dihydrofolate reductase